MLMRFGQAAMLAAIVVLALNSARAEDTPAKGVCAACCKDKDCCKTAKCSKTACKCGDGCKDGKCCKDGTCCKSAECCKSKECCKGACGADCGCCCSTKSKHAKKAAVVGPIIVVMPVPMCSPAMPLNFGCPTCSGMTMACPMLPPGLTPPMMPPHSIAMPVPPPPPPMCYGCPASAAPGGITYGPVEAVPHKETGVDTCLSILGMVTDLCSCHSQPFSLSSMCVSALGLAVDLVGETSPQPMPLPSGQYSQHPPQYLPPSPPYPLARQEAPCPVAILPPPTPCDSPYGCPTPPTSPMVTCSAASPAPAATKVRIVAKPNSDQLEMSVGDDACMTCKKMVVKVGDSSLTLTRIDDKVRVRAAELRAKADCVRTDRKDRLVLEGDVELHYSKDGQSAKVTAERVELNLATSSVTIESAGSLQRIGVNIP